VAFGVVVQSLLEDWPAAERGELLDFYRDVKLPGTLREIGLGEASVADLRRSAEVACRPGSHMHNLRRPISVDELVGVLERLRG
jgi:glycerol dehydrogenase